MSDRRPIEARNTKWAFALAHILKNAGITPNSISILSVFFAALAGLSFWAAGRILYPSFGFFLAAVFIQLRLLCNLLDGMVAIEFGLKSKSGEIFNDFPDRPADIFVLVGAGYAIAPLPFGVELGWAAACLAVLTAYVRVLGKSAGASSYFTGPMAKQHRMALMTIASILCAIEFNISGSLKSLWYALIFICVGCLLTLQRRLSSIISELEKK